jgi:hypothetical protein
MEYLGRVGANPNHPDSFPVHDVAQKLDRFRCGDDDIVLFERPRALGRDALEQDGVTDQAFDMAWEDYDDALKTAKESGRFHRSVERDSGKRTESRNISRQGAKAPRLEGREKHSHA